jgi:hypothetical protein
MVEHAVVDAVGTHLERWWGPTEALIWERGPMHDARPEFRIIRAECRDDGLWLHASAGASAERQVRGTGHEIFVVAREAAPDLVELVTMAAHYAVFGDHDGIHEGHTLNVGRPWLPGSRCDHLYLSTPYLRPPEFRVLAHPQGSAHLLWAVPITEAEKEWRHTHGSERFEQLMEDRKLNPYDARRKSLV